ncbi:unannotated protein [freshwater metagenome]|uniref:Unannotated protein n=1 Tax=freshwater metagenome TaxID=449393 RepID=A0A6J6BBH0_9ZZZZ
MHTTGTGRPVDLMIPSAKNAAVRSSMRMWILINFSCEASKKARDKGALREPGDITTSVIPASMIWRTITRASEVELFTVATPQFS